MNYSFPIRMRKSLLVVIFIVVFMIYLFRNLNKDSLTFITTVNTNPQEIDWEKFSINLEKYMNGTIVKNSDGIPMWNIDTVFESNKFHECFRNMSFVFYGDSRTRYIYPEFLKIANDSILEDPQYPRNSLCPWKKNKECSEWFRGSNCFPEKCLRQFNSKTNVSLTWSFKRLAHETGCCFDELDKSADIMFFSTTAWNFYGNHPIEKIHHDLRVSMNYTSSWFPNTIKIFMSYPNCRNEKKIENVNQIAKIFTEDHHDWIFFHIPTPRYKDYCGGRNHVRYEWADLEARILLNTICLSI
mgnify:CR=1 FL=1|jgi:hypothetical protein